MRRRFAIRTLLRMWDLFALIVAGFAMFMGNEDIPLSQRRAFGIGCLTLAGIVFLCVVFYLIAAR